MNDSGWFQIPTDPSTEPVVNGNGNLSVLIGQFTIPSDAALSGLINVQGEFDGVTDVSDDLIPGKREMRVTLKPTARALGLTLDDVARQLRQGFYGGEAVRLYRGRDQVKVRVRYPDDERHSIADLETLRITTVGGQEIPFMEVANVVWARGYAGPKRRSGSSRP